MASMFNDTQCKMTEQAAFMEEREVHWQAGLARFYTNGKPVVDSCHHEVVAAWSFSGKTAALNCPSGASALFRLISSQTLSYEAMRRLSLICQYPASLSRTQFTLRFRMK